MKRRKIIFIEDDKDHAEIVTNVITEYNSETFKTEILLLEDGEAAKDFFQSGTVNVVSIIILDINLPKIDGMDVLKIIRESAIYSSVPVIILSTSSDEATIDEAYKNGANAYLTKPDSYEDIVEMIKTLDRFC